MTTVRITHIGGPTTLIEAAGWRILTDPTFDAPGRRYAFGWGTSSRKLTGPAISVDDLGRIDAVLLTHDHHADNLDDAGRALLASVATVVTTRAGAQRLQPDGDQGPDIRSDERVVHGLAPWDQTVLEAPDRPSIDVTATPCRHGPPLSRPIVGDVIGFALRWDGQEHGTLWITGDTVLYGDLRRIPERISVGTMLLHLGKVQFPLTGPLRYTMSARDAVELCHIVQPRTAIPVHYEGWQHFQEGRDAIEATFATAPDSQRTHLRWVPIGDPTDLTI